MTCALAADDQPIARTHTLAKKLFLSFTFDPPLIIRISASHGPSFIVAAGVARTLRT
jgi:hypothetical protein